MDFINLSQLIRSRHAKENMPSVLTDEDIPMVVVQLVLTYKVSYFELQEICYRIRFGSIY